MPSTSQTVTQKSDPWEEAQPYIVAALESYQELFESDPEGEQIIENRDLATLSAEDIAFSRSNNGNVNRLGALAQNSLAGILSQSALSQNSLRSILSQGAYAEQAAIYTNVEALVVPTVTAQFAGANRIGGMLYQNEIARGLTDAYAPVALQARQMELQTTLQASQTDLQTTLQAAAISEKVDMAAQADIKMLSSIGTDREAHAARLLAAPYIQKSRWLDAVGTAGGFGGTTQRTSDNGQRGTATALGGALSGASSGFAMGGPFGALLGGGLGLLGGLF